MTEPDHKRCLGCGYILDGLPEPRCPECGRGFDPNDALTYTIKERRRSGWAALVAALVACAAHTTAYLSARSVNFNLRRAPPVSWRNIDCLTLGALIVGFCAVAWSISALRRPPNETRDRWAFSLATALGVLVCLAFFLLNAWPYVT